MYYSTTYRSPVGILTLASDGEALMGLWISGQKILRRFPFRQNDGKGLFFLCLRRQRTGWTGILQGRSRQSVSLSLLPQEQLSNRQSGNCCAGFRTDR